MLLWALTTDDGLSPKEIDRLKVTPEERTDLLERSLNDYFPFSPMDEPVRTSSDSLSVRDSSSKRQVDEQGTNEPDTKTTDNDSPSPPVDPSPPVSNAITAEATAYTALCNTGCTGITATGYDVRETIYSPEGYRIIAADPAVLPLGSVVTINAGGDTFKAKVMDTGGAIKGNRIDLLVGSKEEAFSFGRKDVKITKGSD